MAQSPRAVLLAPTPQDEEEEVLTQRGEPPLTQCGEPPPCPDLECNGAAFQAREGIAQCEISKLCQDLDVENSGTVDRATFILWLQTLKSSWTEDRIEAMFCCAGITAAGSRVNYNAFIAWVFGGMHGRCEARDQANCIAPPHEALDVVRLDPETSVEFLTDVEGNWDYFLHYVSMSKVLLWEGEEQGFWGPGTLTLQDNGVLVFGGDAADKGPGDIRFVKTLLYLKKRFPTRVFIILGNRDINKLRFFAELAEGEDGTRFHPTWDVKSKAYEVYLAEKDLEQGRLSTLHWMLDCNMGCQKTTFVTRKRELALLHGRASDEEVLHSFRNSVDPCGGDPWMLDLLRVGQIALVLGDALFVHGGLYDAALGAVPGQEQPCDEMCEWARQLNAWKDAQLKDFVLQPHWRVEGDSRRRGGDLLIDYGAPNGGDGTTVVYYNPFKDGNPQGVSEKVEAFLDRSGIRRIFSGHQPHGQTPTVVRHLKTGLLQITCDTSYSDMNAPKISNPADNRGDVVNVVRLQGPRVYLDGVRENGSKHSCTLHVDPSEDQLPDALVGRQLTDNSWVKAVAGDRKSVLAALGQGFSVRVQLMHPYYVCLKLRLPYLEPRFRIPCSKLEEDMLRLRGESQEFCCPEPRMESFGRTLALGGLKALRDRQLGFCQEEFHAAKTYIFDCQGTLWNTRDVTDTRSPEQLERAIIDKVNMLLAAGKHVYFLTNDSNRSRRANVDTLLSKGIALCGGDEEERERAVKFIISASYTCANFLKRAMIKKPFLICYGSGLLEELRKVGITDYVATIDDDGRAKEAYLQPATGENIIELIAQAPDIDAVVVGWDHLFSALKIAVASTYLRWNREACDEGMTCPIQLVTCSTDSSGVLGVAPDDARLGKLFQKRMIHAVGNGSMTKAICAAAGPTQEAINVGKPSEMLMDILRTPEAEGGFGIDFTTTILVGDTLETDIRFANLCCLRSLLVLSGATHESDLGDFAFGDPKPTWVVNSLADI